MTKETLGITGIEAVHYYVHNLDRSRRFYTELMDFAERGRSETDLEDSGQQQSAVFTAGQITVVCAQPMTDEGRAARFLKRHPDGIGSITFQVQDVERTFQLIEKRGGTPICNIQRFEDDGGKLSFFSIATPFGDTTFRFIQRDGYKALFPGMETYDDPRGGGNKFGLGHIDHITSNFNTMTPALLWMEHVMGFRHYWDVEFHTTDVAKAAKIGSGLRSVVMYDDESGVKFANNEPWRPYFESSQIYIFDTDHGGNGVQHLALTVPDIISTVRSLRAGGVEFMPTPDTYYDMLPQRIEDLGIGQIDEDIDTLRELEILVDGEGDKSYLLQIFLKDSAGLYGDPKAGPFFYEIIQRKGDEGFGAGNFRALFESIERQQQSEGRI
ncbi:MAG: 4-hydroxyphenylpyruvate dioxygenase [Myxococcota bacterium]